jgi:twitching motility protein PilT
MAEPRITAARLIQALVEQRIVSDEDLIPLLGEERHNLSVNSLELTLVRRNVVSDAELLALKGVVSGLRTLDDTTAAARPGLPAEAARLLGALVLDTPMLTVAVVEDLPHAIEQIAVLLGTDQFAVWLTTATRFSALYRACYTNADLDTRTACRDIFEIFDEAINRGASDVHLKCGRPPVLRVHGALVAMDCQPLDRSFMRRELERIAGPHKLAEAEEGFDADLAYTYGSARFRLNIGADRRGLTLAARKLPTEIPSIDAVRLPRLARSWTRLDRGLVLVTGPTGSGKSTTMAAILSEMIATQDRHIITLEDPIEYELPEGASVVSQRERGASFTTFADGLRQALRQDPDVIFVGELRDLETMRTAITAAETGHLVMATLHTFDSASTVARLVNSFPADEQDSIRAQLAYILKGVLSQTLLPVTNGRGRVAAFEVMGSNPAIANNLRKIDGHNQIRSTLQTSVADGMQTMDMALAELVRAKLVKESDAELKVRDIDDFRRRLRAER